MSDVGASLRSAALLFGVVVVAVGIAGWRASDASAYVHNTEPIVDEACWTAACGEAGTSLTDLTAGNASWGEVPEAFQASLMELEEAAEVLPELETVPGLQTVALSAGAFYVGWKIGNTLNTRWLHLAGVGLGNDSTKSASMNHPQWLWKPSGVNVHWPDPGWYLKVSFPSGDSTSTFRNCAASNITSASNCALPLTTSEMAAAWTFITNGFGSQRHMIPYSHPCPPYCTGTVTSYAVEIPKAAMRDALVIDQALQPFASQFVGISSGWRLLDGCGDATTACAFGSGPANPSPQKTATQTAADGLSDEERHQIDCKLDPSDYACPEVTADGYGWSSSGGWRGDNGQIVTGPNMNQCKFDEDVGGLAEWALRNFAGDYDQFCDDCWAEMNAAQYVTADGIPNPLMPVRQIMRGQYFTDPNVIDGLSQYDNAMTNWRKVSSTPPLQTCEVPAELHWYEHIDGTVWLDRGFFVVFKSLF